MQNDKKKFVVSSILVFISLLCVIYFLVAYLLYLKTKYKKNYLVYYVLVGAFSLILLNQINIFQNLNILFSQLGTRIIHFNLIPVISIGTILNGGLNNNFVYYLNFESFTIYKPEFNFRLFAYSRCF